MHSRENPSVTIHGLASACMIEYFARRGKNAVSLPKVLSTPVIMGLCESHTPQAPLRPCADSLRNTPYRWQDPEQ